MHAELGLGLLALRRGDAAEAEAALDRALRAVPPQPVALVARYLLGVARLLLDRPAEALALWDEVVQSGAPGPSCRRSRSGAAWPWRGTGDLDGGLELLNRFAATVPVTHPLRGDALVQAGWIALERGAPTRRSAASSRPRPRRRGPSSGRSSGRASSAPTWRWGIRHARRAPRASSRPKPPGIRSPPPRSS